MNLLWETMKLSQGTMLCLQFRHAHAIPGLRPSDWVFDRANLAVGTLLQRIYIFLILGALYELGVELELDTTSTFWLGKSYEQDEEGSLRITLLDLETSLVTNRVSRRQNPSYGWVLSNYGWGPFCPGNHCRRGSKFLLT